MRIVEKVESWDQNYGQSRPPEVSSKIGITTPRSSFASVLERIRVLVHCGFDQYDQNISGSFEYKLGEWLNQLDEAEQPYAFLMASRILFVTREQTKALQRHIYERKIRRILLEQVLQREDHPPYRHDLVADRLPEELKSCFFSQLSTSSQINEFMHVNRADLQGHAGKDMKISGASVEELVKPIKDLEQGRITQAKASKDIDMIGRKFFNGKKYLLVLEDFAGSGQTVTSDLERLSMAYLPNYIQRILFCPYICTERAKATIDNNTTLTKSGGVEVLYGLLLPDSSRAFEEETYLWDEYDLPKEPQDIREKIQAMCNKYWHTHHKEENKKYNADLSDVRIMAGGYRDCQLLIVQHTNAPNNSLPIIWSLQGEPEPWKPLFPRVSRY